jgi:hypothetical protein
VIEARFGHVNLVAADWRMLADFYQRSSAASSCRPSATSAARSSRPGRASRARRSAVPTCACRDSARAGRRSRSSVRERAGAARDGDQPARLRASSRSLSPTWRRLREPCWPRAAAVIGEIVTTGYVRRPAGHVDVPDRSRGQHPRAPGVVGGLSERGFASTAAAAAAEARRRGRGRLDVVGRPERVPGRVRARRSTSCDGFRARGPRAADGPA